MNLKDEIAVIRRAAQEDRVAQRSLVDGYADYLFAITLRYMGSREDAEDVLQDAWVKILNHVSTFDSEKSSFKTWITTITINCCLSALKKKRIPTVTLNHLVNDTSTLSTNALDEMATDEILSLVAQLPSSFRTVFNMAVIDGMSHKEIAQQLGITELLSRTRLKRARNVLKAQLTKYLNVSTWTKRS